MKMKITFPMSQNRGSAEPHTRTLLTLARTRYNSRFEWRRPAEPHTRASAAPHPRTHTLQQHRAPPVTIVLLLWARYSWAYVLMELSRLMLRTA